jgi:ATP-binding cassette subfamily G (WHITE) protein 2 (SNQ2)
VDVRAFYGQCQINGRGILPLTETSSTVVSTPKHSQNSTAEKPSTTQKVPPPFPTSILTIDDTHFATLTVAQTLDFALDVKVPKKRLPGESKSQFKKDVINTLLKMYNIEHTKNTLLGGSARVRGVSGGERKRVSIAEMMISRGSICCWDNTTRGLDSSTALDFVKSLRVLTDVYKMPTLVSLYQASESIYALFDKVLVIDGGRQVYFGPAKEARGYFEGLGFALKPRQTTPDYLTGCTDPWEREYAPGVDVYSVPSTKEELEKRYKESGTFVKMVEDKDLYKAEVARDSTARDHFRRAVLEDKHPFTPKKSVYSIPFHQQAAALFRRQFRLKMQDWFTLATSWTTTMLIAILVGTLFFNLPQTSAGAFTRGPPHPPSTYANVL